jgi:hypothetical protein
MSESQWGEEGQNAPPKKKVPTWVWACGGGCLVALILAIVGSVFVFKFGKQLVKEGLDPDLQWPKLQQVLPFDQQPPELSLKFGMSLGVIDMFVLKDSRGFTAVVYRVAEKNAEQVRHQMLDEKFDGGPFGMGSGNRTDVKAATVHVQGRDLKGVRFHQEGRAGSKSEQAEPVPDAGSGPAIMLDVTPEGETRPVILQLVRTPGTDPVTDDEVRAFLKPFHVGSER